MEALGEIGSRAALVAFALNVFVGTFAAVLFWYLWLLVQFRSEWKSRSFDWLLLTVGLMLAWFPLRLYSEWYLHFFSLQGMSDYPAFQFLAIVAAIAYCVIAFRVTTRVSVKIFATVATGLIALLTAVAKLAPTWVEEIAWAIEGWDFSLYLTLLVILVLALSAMIWTDPRRGGGEAGEGGSGGGDGGWWGGVARSTATEERGAGEAVTPRARSLAAAE